LWHYCDIIVTLLWHYCDIIVTLLWHYCDIIVTLLWHYCDLSCIWSPFFPHIHWHNFLAYKYPSFHFTLSWRRLSHDFRKLLVSIPRVFNSITLSLYCYTRHRTLFIFSLTLWTSPCNRGTSAMVSREITHMCKPRRKSRAQEKCRKRPSRITIDNDILYLIWCETCMQYWIAGLNLFWRDRDGKWEFAL
jgi:hypothetical protein